MSRRSAAVGRSESTLERTPSTVVDTASSDDAALDKPMNAAMALPQLSLTTSAAAAGVIIAFWVVSFPRCIILHPVGECSWAGLTVTCMPAIDYESAWNFHLAHWILAGVLFAIGVANATKVNVKQNFLTTAATSGYAVITAAFAVFRAQYGLSKPLLIGAAVHNLFEWIFVATITHATFAARKAMILKSALWITFVIFAVALIPDVRAATLLEQSVGIMLDFFLVLSYFELAVAGPDAEVRSFYALPFVSAAVHLFLTILPLVFANFVVGGDGYFVVINEWMIYLSPVATHAMYYTWGQQVDALCDARGDLEQRFMVRDAKRKMLVAFGLGLIPLVGVGSHVGSCQAPSVLTGTTIARVQPGLGDAFIDRVAQFELVEAARRTPGCRDYVLARNIQDPDEFRFIEKWENADAVTQWMQTGPPAALFHQDVVMRQLLAGGMLRVQGAYMDVAAPKQIAHGGVAFTMGSACTKVWGVVGNWSDCSWVIGCVRAHVQNTTARTLHFASGQHLEVALVERFDDDMALAYSFPGYAGHVALTANATSGGCDAVYRFQVTGGKSRVESVYADFLQNRVPALVQRFSS